MGPHDTQRAVQEEIRQVLDDPALRGAALADAIRRIGDRHGVEPFRAILRALAGFALPEAEARTTMMEIEEHRAAMERAIGRDPGLPVAALDRLHGIDRRLGDPVFESARPDETAPPAEPSPESSFIEHLEAEIRRAERFHRPLSLAMLSCGWGGEGEFPERAEEALRDAARDTDHVDLLEGGGVAVLLPCTGPAAAVAAVERMRSAVAARTMRPWAAGLTSSPVPAADGTALVRQARAALEEALRIGATSQIYREDRRAHARRTVGPLLRASIRQEGGETDVLIEDLSLGGARIISARPLMAGASVELVLRENTARPRRALLTSRVVRALDAQDPAEGEGCRSAVMFLPAPSERMHLASVLADLPAIGPAAGRGAG